MGPDRTSPASASSSPSATPSEPRVASGGAFAGVASAFSRAPLLISVGLHAVVIGACVALSGERERGASAGRPVRIAAPSAAEAFVDPDEPIEPLDQMAALEAPEVPNRAPKFEDELPVEDVAERAPDAEPTPAPRFDDRFLPPPSADLGGRSPAVESVADADAGNDLPAAPLDPEAPAPELDTDAEAPPELVDAPPPDYPRLARRRGWEGSVLLELTLAADGSVHEVRVLESSARDVLDEAALGAVRTWRFVPGRAGRTARHRVTFQLD